MAIIKGKEIMLFLEKDSNFVSIAYATNHTLNIGSNSSEISTKDNADSKWTESTIQSLNWSATTENLLSADGSGFTFDDLVALMISMQPVLIKFGGKSSTGGSVPAGGWTPGTNAMSGSAYITQIDENDADGENASFTATFTGIGALTPSA